MQQIFFSIAQLIEATFAVLPMLGWFPPILFSVVIFLGLVYWLNQQGKYNRKAEKDGTLA